MRTAAETISYLCELAGFDRYLEITSAGRENGANVRCAHRCIVGPLVEDQAEEDGSLRWCTSDSDHFYDDYASSELFDIVFLDGVHTFEQTLRDFNRSLRLLSAGGLVLIDDCFPSDPIAALRSPVDCVRLKEINGHPDRNWMGDTFRIVPYLLMMTDYSLAFVSETPGMLAVWGEKRKGARARTHMFNVASIRFEEFAEKFVQEVDVLTAAEVGARVSDRSRHAAP